MNFRARILTGVRRLILLLLYCIGTVGGAGALVSSTEVVFWGGVSWPPMSQRLHISPARTKDWFDAIFSHGMMLHTVCVRG
jgi:hypothetical protein